LTAEDSKWCSLQHLAGSAQKLATMDRDILRLVKGGKSEEIKSFLDSKTTKDVCYIEYEDD